MTLMDHEEMRRDNGPVEVNHQILRHRVLSPKKAGASIGDDAIHDRHAKLVKMGLIEVYPQGKGGKRAPNKYTSNGLRHIVRVMTTNVEAGRQPDGRRGQGAGEAAPPSRWSSWSGALAVRC